MWARFLIVLLSLRDAGAADAVQATPANPLAGAPAAGIPPPSAPAVDFAKAIQLDGQLRLRYEYADPFAYTPAGVNLSDDAVFMRTRLGALFTLHPRLQARIQIQDSRIWGEEGAATPTAPVGSVTTSIDRIDLHQAFVDLNSFFEDALGKGTLGVRLGRQELNYGDGRLVSPLDWSNVTRAWDAARIIVDPAGAPGGLRVDMFASIIRDTASSGTGGLPTGVTQVDQKQGFHGIYASFEDIHIADGWTRTAGEKAMPILGKHQLDLFTFYRDLSDGVFIAEDGASGDVDEVTLGGRGAGKVLPNESGGGFDYSGEAAYQLGDFAGDDINAYGFALTAGHTFAGRLLGATRLRLGVEYDYGSGDSDPDDGNHETFDPLFPFGHYYQGIGDTFSWKNGQDLAFKLDLFPPKSTRVPHAEVQYHFFWLSEDRDGWFNAGLGQIRRDPTGSASSFVGTELDVTVKYALLDPFAMLWFGYAHFFAGDYVEDTGDDPDRDFAFAQLLVTF